MSTLQELAAHIGEVVVNKCFCTRRNPISISAAAIYLACQLEEKRKTEAEICKVTGPRRSHTTQSVQRTVGELG